MKRLVILALLTIALPIAASATSNNNFELTNIGGTLSGNLTSGLSLSSSILVAIQQGNGTPTTGNLGSVSFTTGALTHSGSDYTFSGGSFTITGNGTNGVPTGTIFTGSFSGTISKTSGHYVLVGQLAGQSGAYYALGYKNGFLTFNIGKTLNSFGSGDTTLTSTPEPNTLALFGSGLIGLVGLLRRRASSSASV